MSTLAIDTTRVREWVAEAGQIAVKHFGHARTEWKGVGDPVTEADLAIEQLLAERLQAAYPQHGILGEEFGGDPSAHEFLWVIDPIDGTRVYVEGLPTWCVTVALFHELKPVWGLVHVPMVNDWTYTEGDEVLCNGSVITHKLKRRWAEDSFVFGRSDTGSLLDVRFYRVMSYGSTATHIAYTAHGTAVATITHDPYLWDIAAGLAFMAKQGGTALSLSGEPLSLAGHDLHQPFTGFYLFGYPEIVRRLQPLVHVREQTVSHPRW